MAELGMVLLWLLVLQLQLLWLLLLLSLLLLKLLSGLVKRWVAASVLVSAKSCKRGT